MTQSEKPRSISIEWCIEDVQEVRPELNDEQAYEVLQLVKDKHDATLGITWDTLAYAADHLHSANEVQS